MSPETLATLRRAAVTIWLKAAPEDHWNRVVRQGDRRPMANHPQAMADPRALLAARDPLRLSGPHHRYLGRESGARRRQHSESA